MKSIEELNLPEDLRYAENEMAVRNGLQDSLAEPLTKFHHPLLMTRGTEVPSLARECEQEFVAALATPDTRKTIMKDAAIKIAVYNVFHIGTEKAILLCEPVIINLFQRIKMIFNALIILGYLRITWLICGRCVGHGFSL